MKTLLAALACVLCAASPALAGGLESLTPYLSTQYFTWKENDGGRQILREGGALVAIGAVAGYLTDSSFTLRGKGELFGGEVVYHGETQPPIPEPIRTDVVYFGTRGELDAGYRAGSARAHLEPFVGVGHRWWLRDIHDAQTADGGAASGYTEIWQTVYGRAGLRGKVVAATECAIVAEAGVKYPFYTGNSIEFAGSGRTTFHPGARWSAFAATGFSYRNVRLTMNYEGFRFSESPYKLVQNTNYRQPESSSDIFGVNLGWAFR